MRRVGEEGRVSLFPETDINSGWGRFGTEDGPHGSFFKRYYRPLARFARLKFKVSEGQAEELAADFMARELERDRDDRPPIFRLYAPDKGRFRGFLAKAFWRYCRDRLERGAAASRARPLGEQADFIAADGLELGRLVVREFLNSIRAEIIRSLDDPIKVSILNLKWPEDLDSDPLTNAAVERRMGLSRSKVRRAMAAIADAFIFALNRRLQQSGLDAETAGALVGDCCRILDAEDRTLA